MVLVTYDVASDGDGPKRLRRLSRAVKDYGQRVLYSVFECEVDPAQWAALRARLEAEIDSERDSIRFYYLGANWRRRVEHIGAKPTLDLDGPLII